MKAPTLHVKPAEGLKVRDPLRNDHLPVEGREVENNAYWRARLRDGDVVEVEPAASTGRRKPANRE